MQLDVFQPKSNSSLPLAAQLRPKSLDEFFGQVTIRTQLEKLISHPRHVIFWGPPGTGKTTLAHLMAAELNKDFEVFSAVTSGIPELKKIISGIIDKRKELHKETILFIDEIHRFNKSQQDALLPYLENGDFLFMGATTEYPQTSLNKALLSRVSLIELKKLDPKDLKEILNRGLHELKRPDLKVFIDNLSELSNGDARFCLNQLSVLASYKTEDLQNKEKILKEIFQYARQYDKNSNRHYDVISAFIKSVRGSDPEAALLYLAIMLDGGEDPEFIARRLMILASEDIGLANSQALQVTTNTHYVTKQIGMPEARISLAQATIYLCLSPKSNSAYLAINEALQFVAENPTIEVPAHLSNTSPEKKNYLYPHDFNGHWVDQEYLPHMKAVKFYHPTTQGSEKALLDQFMQFTGRKK